MTVCMGRAGDNFLELVFSIHPCMVLGTKLKLADLHGKWLYGLSHITKPRSVSYLLWWTECLYSTTTQTKFIYWSSDLWHKYLKGNFGEYRIRRRHEVVALVMELISSEENKNSPLLFLPFLPPPFPFSSPLLSFSPFQSLCPHLFAPPCEDTVKNKPSTSWATGLLQELAMLAP